MKFSLPYACHIMFILETLNIPNLRLTHVVETRSIELRSTFGGAIHSGARTISNFRSMAQWRSRSNRYIGCLCGLADERNSIKGNRNDLSVGQCDFRLTTAVFKHMTFDKTVDPLSFSRFVRPNGGLIVPTAVIDRRDADVLGVVGQSDAKNTCPEKLLGEIRHAIKTVWPRLMVVSGGGQWLAAKCTHK